MTQQDVRDRENMRLNGFGGREPLPYDWDHYSMDGSDLYIASNEAIKEHVESRLKALHEKERQGTLYQEDIDERTMLEAEQVVRHEMQRINELRQEDPLYTQAVEEWIAVEFQDRHADEDQTEKSFDAEIKEITLLIEIVDELLIELDEEKEDPAIIAIAHARRDALIARYDVTDLARLYALAA